MAEPAQAAEGAASSASSIKQEPEHPVDLEGFDFTDLSRELAAKRPLDEVDRGPSQTPEAKRAKTEVQADEESLEKSLALLVQNALADVGDLVDHFNAESDEPLTATTEPMDTARPLPAFSADPQAYVREMNINALGGMALSLLHILVQQPLHETMALIKDAESDHGRSYRQLRHSLEQLRLLYTSKPALSARELGMDQDESRTCIELANLAQLGSWLADGSPGSLSEADRHFLALFSCQVSDLPPGMTDLYLGIMTQRAVESLVLKEPGNPSEEVLGEVLLSGLEDRLREQHGGDELTSADQNFVSMVQSRKETLQGEAEEQAEPTALRDTHPTEHLLRTFVSCVKSRLRSEPELCSRFGISIEVDDEPTTVQETTDPVDDVEIDFDEISSFFERTASILVQEALAGMTEDVDGAPTPLEEGGDPSTGATNDKPPAPTNGKMDLMTDYKELEALVAESTSNYVKTTLHGLSPIPYQPTMPQSTAESMAAQTPYLQQLQQLQAQHPYYTTCPQSLPEPQMPPLSPGESLPPNQTFSSAILYDKARHAALSKSSTHTRREGIHSTRRPWSQEEEKALMAGLDMVKGPHWSQILTLFGHNGTISDILKDRTQVQLKDKARNLKLFFLKTNSEMPYYLQAVTGELKTRAPTQAARKEAEDRARLTTDEEQAKLQGIMALAGGLQHPPHPRVAPAPASTPNASGPAKTAAAASGVGPRAQAASINGVAGHGTTPAPAQGAAPRPPAGNTTAAQRPALTTSTAGAHHAGRPPGAQATTQQVLQAMPQAPLRPQSQLPRPQTQQGNPYQPQGPAQPKTLQPLQPQPQRHDAPASSHTPLQPTPTPRPLAQASPTAHGHAAPAPAPAPSTWACPPAPSPPPTASTSAASGPGPGPAPAPSSMPTPTPPSNRAPAPASAPASALAPALAPSPTPAAPKQTPTLAQVQPQQTQAAPPPQPQQPQGPSAAASSAMSEDVKTQPQPHPRPSPQPQQWRPELGPQPPQPLPQPHPKPSPPPRQDQSLPQQKQPPEPSPTPPAAQHPQLAETASPTLSPPPPAQVTPSEPPAETQHDDGAAEAALLEGLRAVMAQTLA